MDAASRVTTKSVKELGLQETGLPARYPVTLTSSHGHFVTAISVCELAEGEVLWWAWEELSDILKHVRFESFSCGALGRVVEPRTVQQY